MMEVSNNWDGIKIELIEFVSGDFFDCNLKCTDNWEMGSNCHWFKCDYAWKGESSEEHMFYCGIVTLKLTNHNNQPCFFDIDKFKLITIQTMKNLEKIEPIQRQYAPLGFRYTLCREVMSNEGYIYCNEKLMPGTSVTTSLFFPSFSRSFASDEKGVRLDYTNRVCLSNGNIINGYLTIDISSKSLRTNASLEALSTKVVQMQEEERRQILQIEQRAAFRQQENDQWNKYAEQAALKRKKEQAELDSRRKAKEKEKNVQSIKNKLSKLDLLIYEKYNTVTTYRELKSIQKSIDVLFREIENCNELHDAGLTSMIDALRKKNAQPLPRTTRFSEPPEIEIYKYSVKDMSPWDFERYIFDYFLEMDFEAELTPQYNDSGIDIILLKSGKKYGVQCKYYKPGRVIGTEILFHFMGALINISADGGFLMTTAKVAEEAKFIAERNNIVIMIIPC